MFQDPRVRQALAYAFDFEWSNKNLFYDSYARTRSYFDNSELAATGVPQGEELKILEPFRGKIPNEVFTKQYDPPKYDGSGNIRDGLRAALALLKEAGWSFKNEKLVNEQREYWGSRAADEPGSRNLLGVKSEIVDALIEELIRSPDRASLVAHTRALDRVLQYGYYVIPNFHLSAFWVAYWDKYRRPQI